MTEDDIDALRADIDEQREESRQLLAEDLGGEPEDYRADHGVAGGGGE